MICLRINHHYNSVPEYPGEWSNAYRDMYNWYVGDWKFIRERFAFFDIVEDQMPFPPEQM